MTTRRIVEFRSIKPGDKIVLTSSADPSVQRRVLVANALDLPPVSVQYRANHRGWFAPRAIIGADGTVYQDHVVVDLPDGLQDTNSNWSTVQASIADDAEALRQDIDQVSEFPGVEDNPRPFHDSLTRVIAAAAATLPVPALQ